MSSTKPLFGTAIARSGGGLLTHVLSANPEVMLARHPYLEIFREWRDAIGITASDNDFTGLLGPTVPFSDYYFDTRRLELLDEILGADIDLPLPPGDGSFVRRATERAWFESPDIAARMDVLGNARTVREVMDQGLGLIEEVRGGSRDRKWSGFQEPWIVEFFSPLAAAYPEARFIVLMRDIRAVINSIAALGAKEPDQAGQVLSYVRHWRKYAALILHLKRDATLTDRLHVVRYEDIVREPETTVRTLCSFLDVPFAETMIDPDGYTDPATGRPWAGNSSFGSSQGIEPLAAERWRDTLEQDLVGAIEAICEPELRLFQYEPIIGNPEEREGSALRYFLEESAVPTNWRSDFGDPVFDLGAEQFRNALLRVDVKRAHQDLTRRCFLFEHVYRSLRNVGTLDPKEGFWKRPSKPRA